MTTRSNDPLYHDGARYRAALQPWYSDSLSKQDFATRTEGRIENKDLDLLSGTGLITLSDFLYSAHHGVKHRDQMIEGRDTARSSSLADSGGYQISTGAATYSETLLHDLLRYSENFDAAPILDGPTSAIFNDKSSLKSVEECFDFTVKNGEYAIQNRIPGKTRLLNVVQGLNFPQAISWYEGVKFLNDRSRFGERAIDDWAFAGVTRTHLSLVLTLIVMMRDEQLIQPGAFIHFLGLGSPELACAFTALQDGLRETVDGAILVSFDSATPFLMAGGHKKAAKKPILDTCKLSIPYTRLSTSSEHIGSSQPWPSYSPFADRLTMGDLCFHASGRKTTWDQVSLALVAAHNVWVQSFAIAEVNRRLRRPLGQALKELPARIIHITEAIREILASEKPMTLIRQQQTLLDSLSHKSRGTTLHEDDWRFRP